jgi:hypothetical protein
MIRTSIPTTILPRAKALTDALVAPAQSTVTEDDLVVLRRTMEAGLPSAGLHRGSDERVRVDGYLLRTPPTATNKRPFAWSPWTARRPIALEAVRAWLSRPALSPVRAVEVAIAALLARPDERPGSLSAWLQGLSSGARSVAQAEAVTWATQLFGALEWGRLERAVVGGDRSVGFEAAPQVRLHARVDVRTALPCCERAESGLFLAMTGRPGATAAEELGLAALTLALDPRLGIPARVIGWWPQCGRAAIADVDLPLLTRTAAAVVRSLGSLGAEPDVPSDPPVKLERPTQPMSRRPRLSGEEVAIAS